MTEKRRAGEPEVPRRPAGTPEPPAETPAGPDESANPAAAEVERDFDALLDDTRRERDEYLDLAQRTRADFENYRRRATEDAKDAERRGRTSLARELVPSLDNLERALRAAGIDPDADVETDGGPTGDPATPARDPSGPATARPSDSLAEDVAGLVRGVLLVYRELRSTLERAGVETYDPAGERFDPEWHEALATRAQEGTEAGVVLETVEKGFRLDGQVLRAAKVIVSE
ncbi:MAG: nucleotide exchange factor GrpE [Solirubrobacterales bacterium]